MLLAVVRLTRVYLMDLLLMDKLGVFHANQTSMSLDPQLN